MNTLRTHATVWILATCLSVPTLHSWASAQDDTSRARDRTESSQKARDDTKATKAKKQDEQQVSGKVKESRQARVSTRKGEDVNRVVLLETEDGKDIAVDLGSEQKLKNIEIKRGTPVTATGSVVSVDGKPVFLVSRVQVGDQAMNVSRNAPDERRRPKIQAVSGKIADMREMTVKGEGTKHQVAVLESGKQAKKMLVDLGPKDQLSQLNLAKGDQAKVEGIAMNINQRRVLVARTVRKGDESVTVERKALPNLSKAAKQMQAR